jgi:hypothetical protein
MVDPSRLLSLSVRVLNTYFSQIKAGFQHHDTPGHMASLDDGISHLLMLRWKTHHFEKYICSSRVYGSGHKPQRISQQGKHASNL